MRRLWRWVTEVSIGGVLMLIGRWSLRVATPADDLEAVRRVCDRAVAQLREYWSILWRAYGPVTNDMRSAWEKLRTRYQRGSYGQEGT